MTLLWQQMPTWLVQMLWLLSAADREPLPYELHGAARERMLWEGAAAEVRGLHTADRPGKNPSASRTGHHHGQF